MGARWSATVGKPGRRLGERPQSRAGQLCLQKAHQLHRSCPCCTPARSPPTSPASDSMPPINATALCPPEAPPPLPCPLQPPSHTRLQTPPTLRPSNEEVMGQFWIQKRPFQRLGREFTQGFKTDSQETVCHLLCPPRAGLCLPLVPEKPLQPHICPDCIHPSPPSSAGIPASPHTPCPLLGTSAPTGRWAEAGTVQLGWASRERAPAWAACPALCISAPHAQLGTLGSQPLLHPEAPCLPAPGASRRAPRACHHLWVTANGT